MTQEIRIPDIGDAEDVEVVEIIAASGDEVGEDDPIIVIESDKASMEVPAGLSGTIDEITVSVGDKVSEGQVIARLRDGAGGETGQTEPDEGAEADEQAGEGGEEQKDQKDRKDRKDRKEQKDQKRQDRPDRESKQAEEREQAEPADERDGKGAGDDEPGKQAARKQAGGGARTVEVKVPDIGDAEGVEVIEVVAKAGDEVDVDDVLVVVESDKASMEIPSSHAGTIKEVHVAVGTEVEEGTLLVTLETAADSAQADEDSAEADAPPRGRADAERGGKAAGGEKDREDDSGPAEDQAPAPERRDQPATTRAPEPPRAAEAEAGGAGPEVYAGPAVRRLARELGVELQAVKGTGSRGRIVKDDVKEHVKSRMTGDAGAAAAGGGVPPMPKVDFSKFGEIEEQPLSRTRARGAENLHRAWLNIPHVTQHDEVDVTDLEDFRVSLKAEGERRGVKVTPVAFIIKACCHVLKEFPTVNASLDPAAKTFILKRYYHIGMAVDTPEGLVVPVIHDADRKGVWELSAEIAELAEKARNKKLKPSDMQGGSFSVSSLGAIGGTGFTPIINAPEVAILGVGRLATRPVWKGEAFVPRKMLPLSLSYDHRAINGAEAGRFVSRLGEVLSDIRRLAL